MFYHIKQVFLQDNMTLLVRHTQQLTICWFLFNLKLCGFLNSNQSSCDQKTSIIVVGGSVVTEKAEYYKKKKKTVVMKQSSRLFFWKLLIRWILIFGALRFISPLIFWFCFFTFVFYVCFVLFLFFSFWT